MIDNQNSAVGQLFFFILDGCIYRCDSYDSDRGYTMTPIWVDLEIIKEQHRRVEQINFPWKAPIGRNFHRIWTDELDGLVDIGFCSFVVSRWKQQIFNTIAHNWRKEMIITGLTHPDHHTVNRMFAGGLGGHIYVCDSYDPNCGYWMTPIWASIQGHHDNWPASRKNVSEQAIGRSYHEIWTTGPDDQIGMCPGATDPERIKLYRNIARGWTGKFD